ncbi:TPR repeat-containing protein YfgC precursor [compost metagenome]
MAIERKYIHMKGVFKYSAMVLACVTLASGLSGCATSAVTGKKYLKLVSADQVNQQAALAYKDFLSKNNAKVVTGTADAAMVKRVGNKLATAVNQYLQSTGRANQFNFNWEFNLVKSDDVNAWCMPGGKVAVYTGILPVTRTEAGLATVMGHEIAHAIEEHSVAQASNQIALQLGGQILGSAAGVSGNSTLGVFNNLYGLGGNLAQLKFSRSDESDADAAGLIIMALAGYNPNEAVDFWKRMASGSQKGQPEFLSTHPSDERRIADIQRLIPNAMKYYKK